MKTLQELFADKTRWTTYARARDKNSMSCHIDDSEAVCWCLLGGIEKIYRDDLENQKVRTQIEQEINHNAISYWNDHVATIEDVQKLTRKLNI